MTNESVTNDWTIYVCNDNCPDYTWGYTEEQTRQAFADIVRGHLDEMARTDAQPPENRDRYTMAVTQEALCFVERYPDRKDDLVRRIREGRVMVSPFLCNTLWGTQSVEGVLRAFYPARRLERKWGIAIDVADHIEEPSLPWGIASLLAGCGIRWLQVAFLSYDSTFKDLTCPPLFIHEGPDGGQVRVAMDAWASLRSGYVQGRKALEEPAATWIEHYSEIGEHFPLRAILASGTHGDISPTSADQVAGFADAIIAHNAQPDAGARYVNATMRQYAEAVDAAHAAHPFLPVLRGCFGHSWEVWPVSLARIMADGREAERRFLRAEALVAAVGASHPELARSAPATLARGEWHLAMLGDHAWNGTSPENKQHNADLRRGWRRELNLATDDLAAQAWEALGLRPDGSHIALFNGLSAPRQGLVRMELSAAAARSVGAGGERGLAVSADKGPLASQIVDEDGVRVLYFVSPEMAGYGLSQCRVTSAGSAAPGTAPKDATPTGDGEALSLAASDTTLDSPFYRLTMDMQTGGIANLVHKATGTELAVAGHPLCQTVYFDGESHPLSDVTSQVSACGPVLARLCIRGKAAGVVLAQYVTVYAELDRVDFDLRIEKQPTDREERLCQFFPVLGDGLDLRVETTGAVIRPVPQPQGDLLLGADTRRFAVQNFVHAALPGGPGVTIASLDAFVLRRDLGEIVFEALGNDQNYKEVLRDQGGDTRFRFRYSLRAHGADASLGEAAVWSRSVASPILAVWGVLGEETGAAAKARRSAAVGPIQLDPARAIATCFKPADVGDGSLIVRFQEISGRSGPLPIGITGFRHVMQTDLLERDQRQLPIEADAVTLDLPAHGFASLRLIP